MFLSHGIASALGPFSLVFVQRGVLEIAALSVAAGLIGTLIVLRGLAFFSHAVGTAAFPGLVLADGLGFSARLGAGATALAVALAVGWLGRRERERYDSGTALVLVAALALGVVLASDVFGSGANVETLLFGSLLVIAPGDVWFALLTSAVVAVAGIVLEPRWLITGFDPAGARGLGVRSALPDLVLLALVALVAVAALSAVGALLATALLVVPAASTRLVTARLRTWQLATVVLVLAEGIAGLGLSVQTNAPPGATIAVLSGAVFVVLAVAGELRGRVRAPRALPPVGAAAGTVLAALALAGCGTPQGGATARDGASPLAVVATTTQLADFVRAVGGPAVRVRQILRPNTDPHEYEPRPQDVQDTAGARVVFVSGDGLDGWMPKVVAQSGGAPSVVDVGAALPDEQPGAQGRPADARPDPHWWHDPVNVEAAIDRIRDALTRARPSARPAFARRAGAYTARVRRLDAGIRACFARVAPAQLKLVTNHDAFAPFAHRFGVRIIGAVIPSLTTQAQPSAGDVARLGALIAREHVHAVFPESSVNPKLARALARQTGASSAFTLYGDTLGPAGSTGATYLQMEQANADQMLRGFTRGRDGCRIDGL